MNEMLDLNSISPQNKDSRRLQEDEATSVESSQHDKEKENTYQGQMIGNTPGLELEDIQNIETYTINEIKGLDVKQAPYQAVDRLFAIEDELIWIKDALQNEAEKEPEDQNKNKQLKDRLQKTLQDLIESLGNLIDSEDFKPPYIVKTMIESYVAKTMRLAYKNGMELDMGAVDLGMMGMTGDILAYVPSTMDIFAMRHEFMEGDEHFRIKHGRVSQQQDDGSWKPLEEIPKYTHINPELVTSKNVIKLFSLDKFFYNQLDIPVHKVSFREKLYLYEYLLQSDLYDLHMFSNIVNKQNNQEAFMRSFLSLEHGGKDMGEKILGIGENLPEETAERVFQKYSEIVDSVEDTIQQTAQRFGEKELSEERKDTMRDHLLAFAKSLLEDIYEQSSTEDFDPESIIEQLESYNQDLYAFTKEYPNYRGDLESLGMQVAMHGSSDYSQEDIRKLERLLTQNRKDRLNEDQLEELKQELHNALSDDSDAWFIDLRDTDESSESTGELVAFVRCEAENDGYFIRGLSFHEQAAHPMIAYEFMQDILDRVGDKPLYAEVDASGPLATMYQKRFGFEIVEEKEKFGTSYYTIKRYPGHLG